MRRILLHLLVACLFIAGCGLPTDTEPRVTPLDDIPLELWPGQLPTPTPTQLTGTGDVGGNQVHMISEANQLQLVEREVADSPALLLEILVNGTEPEEAAAGVTSVINARTTRVQDVTVTPTFQLATVDLAPGSLDEGNSERMLAFAQIVYTLTSLPDIERVSFVQSDPDNPDAEPTALAVQTDTGSKLPGYQATRADFESVAPRAAGTRPSIGFDLATATPTVDPSPRFPVTIWKVRQVFRGDDGVEVVGEADTLAASQTTIEARIIGVVRQLEQVTPETSIASLFAGTPAGERNLGLRSAFPPDAFLNSVTVTTYGVRRPDRFGQLQSQQINIATIDLADGSLPSASDGSERLLAAAQAVFTLTGLDEVDEVTFSIDGDSLQMPTDNGLSSLFDPADPRGLTRIDYAFEAPGGYLWLPQPPPVLTPTAVPQPTPTPDS